MRISDWSSDVCSSDLAGKRIRLDPNSKQDQDRLYEVVSDDELRMLDIDGDGRVMVGVDRASDIRQLLRWSKRHGVRIAISGGAAAWELAPQLENGRASCRERVCPSV